MAAKPVLPANFREVLQDWREAWCALFLAHTITMPNKFHIIYHHLQVPAVCTVHRAMMRAVCKGAMVWFSIIFGWCCIVQRAPQDYYEETGASLTRTTDQTIESAHQWLAKLMARSNYFVKDVSSPRQGEMMLKGWKS
jgi:hypothetical protein